MLDCREQKTIEKLSEELEKSWLYSYFFQVVPTKSKNNKCTWSQVCKNRTARMQSSNRGTHDGKKRKNLTGQLFREQKI